MDKLLKRVIERNFPTQHIRYAFGYGSAVFKQANYDQGNSEQVIDMILVVDDTYKFHQENMSLP
jgi:hypothetical protein